MGSDVTEFPSKVLRETVTRPLGQLGAELRRSGIPGVAEIGRITETAAEETQRIQDQIDRERTSVARSPEGQAAITIGATLVNPTLGAAVGAGFSAQNALRASRAELPSLTTQPTVATRIQSESRSAILDLRARLRQSGSRGKSNQGIPQLNPLPSFQGPVLAGKLG